MTQLAQTPAVIDILVAIDDSFSSLIDFDISLAGQTVTATVDHEDGSTTTDFTVVDTDLPEGQVTISLTPTQIATIGAGVHHWYLKYGTGSTSRRAFAGKFTVIKYKK